MSFTTTSARTAITSAPTPPATSTRSARPRGAARSALTIRDYRPLRALFVANPLYWREEFHIDGFRLDATHAILDESPRHILEEITGAIHEHGGFAIAEDSRNDSRVVLPTAENGLGFDARMGG